ncbi:unnamed protein product [Bursaphelenchus okinawaensis]|uniref:t-SNARE coiled-coil homology domain-containing protein n=1 Tax=Bursaphelenchus okinawaensis TaxID=465554 RepID=A0A811JVH9_9BILA|nr:unnamed protein product [Bursaphelenchus okinawaensis]CAG9085196.1 unnamed protein product [Bursaphelenchus okinawaensis]
MDWNQASFTVDRFIRVCDENLAELRQKHSVIQKSERERDYERATTEKEDVKKLINQIQTALQELLSLRSQLDPSVRERFDARIEGTRNRITQAITLILPKLGGQADKASTNPFDDDEPTGVPLGSSGTKNESSKDKDTPFKPTGPSNPFDTNLFDDCFDDEQLNRAASEYEAQLQVEAERSYKEKRLQDLKLKAEQARADAEATKKLNNDIEDLNQIMVDLAQLVHGQNEMVDSIEDQVERTVHDVNTGHRELKKAVRTKQARVPFYAAAVGSLAAGGPVAVAAGSMVAGAAAAVGGAIAGLYGGRMIKKKVADENS